MRREMWPGVWPFFVAGFVADFATIFNVRVAMVRRRQEYWGIADSGCRGERGAVAGIVADFVAGDVAGAVANLADTWMLDLVALLIGVMAQIAEIVADFADFVAGILAAAVGVCGGAA